ncbi:MAG: histidine phosphatase family protein [bacterium]
MKLILVRHSESTWNKLNRVQGIRNPKLSEKGYRQSQLLAQRFNGTKFDAVYSSHLSRAYQTAKILTNSKNDILIHQDLHEIKLGIWEGKTINQVRKENKELYKEWYQKPLEVRIPGAETLLEFKERVVRVFDEIRTKHPDQQILVVTHGGVITTYLAHLLEMNLNKVWSISLKNSAVTIISFSKEFPCVLVFNDTCHLDFDEDLVTW